MDRTIDKKKWPAARIAKYALAGLLILVFLYALISGFKESTLNIKAGELTISIVKKGKFQDFIPVTGTVMPVRTIYLDAVEGGRVEKIFAEAGTMVKEGDRLLKLSNTNLLMTVLNNEAMVNRAINDLRITRLQMEQFQLELEHEINQIDYEVKREKRKLARRAYLFKEELISKNLYENYEYYFKYLERWRESTLDASKKDLEFREKNVKHLEEAVKQMQKSLDLVRNQLENLTIKAPVSGHLTSLNAELGESKTPGERLGQIDVMDGFKARVEIDEHFISRVEIGMVGTLNLSGRTFQLKVQKVYPEVKEGKFEVDMAFQGEEPGGITRGQTLNIRLQFSDESEALMLERGGFFHKTGGLWVYVLDSEGEFAEKRPIRLGRQNPHFFEVLEGLEPGEKVITSSYKKFGDMERLRVSQNK